MDFFGLFNKKEKSGSIAKNRLQMVLVTDRALVSPQVLQALKSELIEVLCRYVEIDQNALNIDIGTGDIKDEEKPALVANIPIKAWKKR